METATPTGMSFYSILKHTHSGLRWVVLILLIYAIYNAFTKKTKNNFTSSDKKINLFTLAAVHTQLLIGLSLYSMAGFFSLWSDMGSIMKNSYARHIIVEHLFGMLIAVIFITIGYSKSKRASTPNSKHSKIYGMFLIALIIILASIPWPFRFAISGWF